MKILLATLLLPVVLCTCGPSQDTTSRTEPEQVQAAEKLFNGAYQQLDAALMERLLTDDFEVVYPDQESRKTKQQWISELSQLRAIFPQLEIIIDSSRLIPYNGNYIVQGTRQFKWNNQGQTGSYSERFSNRWRREDGAWRMYGTRVRTER